MSNSNTINNSNNNYIPIVKDEIKIKNKIVYNNLKNSNNFINKKHKLFNIEKVYDKYKNNNISNHEVENTQYITNIENNYNKDNNNNKNNKNTINTKKNNNDKNKNKNIINNNLFNNKFNKTDLDNRNYNSLKNNNIDKFIDNINFNSNNANKVKLTGISKINDNIEINELKNSNNNIISIKNSMTNYSNNNSTIKLGNQLLSKSMASQTYKKNGEMKNNNEEEEIPFPKISDFLIGREKENESIYKYIKTGLYENGNYSSLYISGMPGSGKTESVKNVIEILQNQYKKYSKNQNKFQTIYINGMNFLHPKDVFKKIYENIFDKKIHLKLIINSLDEFFKNRNDYNSSIYLKNPNNCHIILVLDEVDLLLNKSQNLLYNIFNWTTYPNSKLIVISISNILDLNKKLLPKIQSRIGNNRIIFKPYTQDELYKIIVKKGININIYSEDALKVSSMKVATINGDLRRIIQILNKSKEIYEEEKNSYPKIPKNNNLISKYHIMKACSELFDSKIIQVLKRLSISEIIILATIFGQMKDNNKNMVRVVDIFKTKNIYLKKYNENEDCFELNINWDEFQKIIYNLLRLNIISFLDNQKNNFMDNYIVIKFYNDEFFQAYKDNETIKPIIDLINT